MLGFSQQVRKCEASSEGEVLGGARGETSQPLDRFRVEGLSPPKFMPLRLLEYVSRIYGNLVDSKSKFSDQLIPLAKPEFIVFYTGKEEIPPESYLYMSDAFKLNHDSNSETTLELKVKVCKIKGRERQPQAGKLRYIEQF